MLPPIFPYIIVENCLVVNLITPTVNKSTNKQKDKIQKNNFANLLKNHLTHKSIGVMMLLTKRQNAKQLNQQIVKREDSPFE